MEKYSKWRDAGTGIQPFLPPVASSITSLLPLYVYKTVAFPLAVVRLIILISLLPAWGIFVAIPHRVLGRKFSLAYSLTTYPNAFFVRSALLYMGYLGIDAEVVSTKRGVKIAQNPKINPKKGDVIFSNWTSYVDILYLAFRFNPIFALPIHAPFKEDSALSQPTTGRQTGTGSSALNLPTVSSVPPSPLLGYVPVSFFTLLSVTGMTPQQSFARYIDTSAEQEGKLLSLEQIRSEAAGPVVVFVEGTTGNGRGLLRISKGLFGMDGWEVPVRRSNVWICWFKHPPPTEFASSPAHTIPSSPSFLNPFPHVFQTLQSLVPRSLTVRWLHPDCSPSSGDFLPSDILGLNSGSASTLITKNYANSNSASNTDGSDVLAQCLAVLLLQLGRAKQIGMGWEDKQGFLDFWEAKKAGVKPVSARNSAATRGKKRA